MSITQFRVGTSSIDALTDKMEVLRAPKRDTLITTPRKDGMPNIKA